MKWALLTLIFASACLAKRPETLLKSKPPIPPPETGVILRGSTFSIENGDICVNGKPHFLTGAILLEGVDHDSGIKSTGYLSSFAWIYELLPDYQNAQKLGLDIFGVTPEHSWRSVFRPKPIPRRNMTALNRPLKSGLPIIAELALQPGSHAWMTFMDGVNPEEQAWVEGKAHGTPYSVVTPAGLQLWKTIWRTSAQYFQNIDVKPFAYRLFADVDTFDTNFSAQLRFAKHLSETFTNIAALNETIDEKLPSFSQAARFQKSTDHIGLHVLYTEFLEKTWLNALIHATNTLTSATGGAPAAIFIQPHSLDNQGIDLFSIATPQALLCAPAVQENPILTALVLRAAASGKPLVICDVQVRDDDTNLRNTLLTQFARGYSIALLDTWKRDARAWIRYKREVPSDGGRPRTVLDPIATELAGQQYAAAHPDHILNPYAVQTSTFGGIRMAKQDTVACNDLFAHAHRSAEINVALLHTRTSERLRGTTRYITPTNDIAACMTALTDAGYKLAAIGETQLTTLTNTTYQIIVASDSSFATQAETTTQLMQFVKSGGTVILTPHALTRNAYGMALIEHPFSPSSDWTPSERHGIKLQSQSYGSGHAIRLDTPVTPATLRILLDTLISDAGVTQTWECVDPATGEPLTGIEVAHAVNDVGMHGLILFNRTETIRQARFRLHSINKPTAFDLVLQKKLPVEAGGFLIELKPNHGEIITVSEANESN